MESIKYKLEEFMLLSNKIEGELGLNPNDFKVSKRVYEKGINSLSDILEIHKDLTKHLKVDWSGKWRTCNVRVGNYIAPDWSQVPSLMAKYWDKWNEMDSWTAHNEYQKIHSFRDFNGRVGRLIWLSRAINEGYDFSISFLHSYYYQTLRNYHG